MSCLIVSATAMCVYAEAQTPVHTNVLLLYSWYRGMPWQKALEAGFKQKITEENLSVRLYEEYIDGGRFPLRDHAEGLYRFLKTRYRGTPMDMVISEGLPAVEMMMRTTDLFPNARKLAVQPPMNTARTERNDLWRIFIHQNYSRAVSSMIAVYNPERVVVVVDVADAQGKKRLIDFKQGLESIGTSLPVTYLTDTSMETIVHHTDNLPRKTAIFFLPCFHGEKGHRLTPYEAVQRIARTANAPVFTHWDTLMGSGVVGGYVLSGEKVGIKMAEALTGFIKNRDLNAASGFDMDPGSIFEHQYDWRQLQRFNISNKRIPKDALILNKPESVFKKPLNTILTVIVVIVIMSTLIIILLLSILYRKRAEKTINETLLRQHELVRASNVGLWDWDITTGRVYFSDEWKRQIGYDAHEISNDYMEWESRVHPDDLAQTVEKVQNSIATANQNHQVEFRFRHKDGSYRWILTQASVLTDKSGSPERMIGSHVDITEQKHTEKALKDSQMLLRTLIQTLPDLVWLKDQDGVYLSCNSRFEKFLGATENKIIGKTDYHFFDKKLADFFRGHDQLAMEKGTSCKNEEEIVFADDGHHEILETIKTPMYESDGKFVGVLGIGRDITERKQAENALRDSEERFRRALENIPDVVVIYDPELKIKYINAATTRLTGMARTHYVGKKDNEIWPPEVYSKYLPTLKKARDTGTIKSIEIELPLIEGQISYVKITCVPLIDKNGIVKELLGITHDLTDHYKAQAEKREYESKLMQARKMESIGNLAGGIAHDFNNILFSVMGFTELALDDAEKGSRQEHSLQEIYTATKRAKELVWQILAFARQTEEPIKPVRIDKIAREALKFIRSTIPSTIEIEHTIESDSFIMGNPTQIHQIFMNLCTNAAHAMDTSDGVLTISLKDVTIDSVPTRLIEGLSPGDYIELNVSDTGGGIPSDIIASIFEPYFTTKALGEGTGMGLAVVHGIVEKSGGKIFVNSRMGEGATFSIYLPISKKCRQLQSQYQYEPEELPSGTERILFVDDEAAIAKMIGRNLGGLGYSVTTRTSSVEALALFKTKPEYFDLVISDMTMPNMTGDILAVELMTIRPDIPVILCTGYSKRISEEIAKEIGIKAFAYKPIMKADLAKTVRKVLNEAKDAAQG